MFNLFELDKMLKEQQAIYKDCWEYATGTKQYPTSPYMQEYYMSLIPELSKNISVIKQEIIKQEKSIGVRS